MYKYCQTKDVKGSVRSRLTSDSSVCAALPSLHHAKHLCVGRCDQGVTLQMMSSKRLVNLESLSRPEIVSKQCA